MPLLGQFEKGTKSLKTVHSWNWLARGDLKQETDPLLVAAQDQYLNNRCQFGGESVETVTHIINGCKILAQKQYKRRDNKVCSHFQ